MKTEKMTQKKLRELARNVVAAALQGPSVPEHVALAIQVLSLPQFKGE